VPPALTKFNFDISADAEIEFFFAEPVELASLDPAKITLVGGVNATQNYTLTGQKSPSAGLSQSLTLILNETDSDAIKVATTLCVSNISCTFVTEAGMVVDRASNAFKQITSPEPVAVFSADSSSPSLTSFSLNLVTLTLSLTFSEAVDVSTLNVTKLTLQSADDATAAGVQTLTLTGGNVSELNAPVVDITLSTVDGNALKRLSGLATKKTTTFLSSALGAVRDMVALDSVAVAGKAAASYTADTKAPQLVTFSADMNQGVLSFTFAETVNAYSFDVTKVTIQDKATASSGASKTLTAGAVSFLNSTGVNVTLVAADLNAIKLLPSTATFENNTYLALGASAVKDMNNRASVAISDGSAEEATGFTKDTTAPTLERWSINLESKVIQMTFSEAIDQATFNTSLLKLHSNASLAVAGHTRRLVDVNISTVSTDGTTFALDVSTEDIEGLKLLTKLCTEAYDCNMFVSSDMASDMVGNAIAATPTDSLKTAGFHTEDGSRPFLVQFQVFNMSTGSVTLSFSESVDKASFNVSSLSFHSEFNDDVDSSTSPDNTRHFINDATVTSPNGETLTFTLSTADLNAIKETEEICLKSGNCFIRFGKFFLTDLNYNPVVAVESSVSFGTAEAKSRANIVIQDEAAPILESFSLSMNSGLLSLTFDEPVQYAEFVPRDNIVLQNSSSGGSSVTLTSVRDQDVSSYAGLVLNVTLNVADMIAIKAKLDLATSHADTFLSMNDKVTTDTSPATRSGVANAAIPSTAALAMPTASQYIADTTPPSLTKFDTYNNGDGSFAISFDEPVALDANLSKITFSANNNNSYTLQHSGTITYADTSTKTKLNVAISPTDLNAIRLVATLLTSAANSKIQVGAAFVDDTAGTTNAATGTATQVADGGYFADSISAKLTSFTLNMNNALLSLTFNDVIDVSTMTPKHLFFQSSSSSGDTPTPQEIGLTGGTSGSADSYVLDINITDFDLNTLKLESAIATHKNNTFVHFNPLFIKDAAGTHINSVDDTLATQATSVTKDTTKPELVAFHLDMNAGQLIMTFSEAVSASFDLTAVKLHNAANSSSSTISLKAASTLATRALQTVVIATLDQTDMNTVTADGGFAVGLGSTFLSVDESAVVDTNANKLKAIADSSALRASNFTADETAPVLSTFQVDLNQKQIDLTFSETVNVTTLNASAITLLGSSSGITHKLTGQTVLLTSPSTVVSFGIDPDDVDALKLDDQIGSATTDTSLEANVAVVYDMAGNPSAAVSQEKNISAAALISDSTDPAIDKFIVNMDNGTIALKFNEPIRANTFKAIEITLQNALGSPTESHVLTSGSARAPASINGYDLVVLVSYDDLNSIKRADSLFTNKASSFLSATSATIDDMAGNNLTAFTEQAAAFVADTTDPKLVGFAVDMNSSSLILNFDEPVRANTLTATGITVLSNNASTPKSSFKLTGGNTTSANDLQIVVEMTAADTNAIKEELGLLTSNETSFIAVSSGFIKDMANNPVESVSNVSAIRANAFTDDLGKPILLSFDLNMSTSILDLTFSETVAVNTTNVDGITLQTSSYASVFQQHTLTTATTIMTATDGLVIQLNISENDMDEMKSRLIGSTKERTWLTASGSAIKDTNQRPLAARVNGANAVQVTTLGFDNVKPSLEIFDLNMNIGMLMLSFSEVIDERSLNVAGLTLLSDRGSNITANYTLTNTSLLCTSCDVGFYEVGACSRGTHGSCSKCTECSASQYYTRACNSTTDATCETCSSCDLGEFISGPCTGFSDTVCSNCTSCPTNTYEVAPCNVTHDVQCSSCTSCAANEFVVSACNATHDTVCKAHTSTCANGHYRTNVGNATHDTQCKACSACGTGTYLQRACQPAADTVCATCATPEAGLEYTTQECNATHDAVLDVCDVCPGGTQFTQSACAGTNNTVCAECAQCPNGTFTSQRCTRTSNTVCADCTANCASCGTEGACNECETGFVRNLDNTCTSSCKDGSYVNGTVCMVCHAACGTCTGPDYADCATCSSANGYQFDAVTGTCAKTDACATLMGDERHYRASDNTCKKCHDRCAKCYGGLVTECSECFAGNVTAGHGCYDACPTGYYDNGDPEKCHQCPPHCASCSDGKTCTTCNNGKFLVNGMCLEVCPSPTEHGVGN
jgi:hypothetical protein